MSEKHLKERELCKANERGCELAVRRMRGK